MSFIRKITQDVHMYSQKLILLENRKKELNEKLLERKDLVKQRKSVKNKIFLHRQVFAKKINENLISSVVDYGVNVKFYEGLYSPDFEQIIKEAMNWRTISKANYIASKFSPFQMLELIKTNDFKTIVNEIIDSNGSKIFSITEAQLLITTLRDSSVMHKIERCEFDDKPEIKIARTISTPNDQNRYVIKDFSKLSLGQQQSILLTILLFSNNKCPLIIDQPEDNLDSEFIYKTLVKSLRKVKEHRQVIIVTHNANIAVLGDAELIVPLRSTSEKTTIMNRGSIDTQETKTITCAILEGSEQAFRKRKEIYGI